MSQFKRLLEHVESPRPELIGYDYIIRENRLWDSDGAEFYLGKPSDSFVPGDIDPNRASIIGGADEDSPLALDYRTTTPRVVYLGEIDHESYWIELSPSYKRFIEMLSGR